MLEVEVVGVRIELPSNQPLVLLKERQGQRHLPIWIGAHEASAIAFIQQGITPPRPMTHDLLVNLLDAIDQKLTEVRVVAVRDTVFHATLVLENGTTVEARASDAIAIALRVPCPIMCAQDVMDEAGVEVSADAENEDEVETPEQAEHELKKFREFLADVEPEDFEN